MATDSEIDIEIDLETGEVVAREPRIPNAVWINRPSHAERGSIRPAGAAVVGAIVVVALLVLAAFMTRDEPLVPAAAASTAAAPTGNGPTGYFPDTFERGRGELEPQPPSF
jgi:hypothetical protein